MLGYDERKQIALSYCQRMRNALNAKRSAESGYQEAKASMDMLNAVRYDREGKGSGMAHGDDQVASALERLYSAGDRMVQAITEWTGEYERFAIDCNHVDGGWMLLEHYAHGTSWHEIAGRSHYEYDYLIRGKKDMLLLALYEVMCK